MSAFNPGAIVASAFYLGGDRGPRHENAFLIGGLLISLMVGIVVLVLIRVIGLELPQNRTPRYDVRLGILALLLAAFLPWLRTHLRRGDSGPDKPSPASRLMEGAGIAGAVVVGGLIYAPSVQYLAGLQAIATADRPALTAVLLICLAAIINVAIAWGFLLAYLRAPDRTRAHLAKANTWISWVKAHSGQLIRVALGVVGAYLVISGVSGLASPSWNL